MADTLKRDTETTSSATKRPKPRTKADKAQIAEEFEQALLGTKNPNVVDNVFEELLKLSPAVSTYAINTFEKDLIEKIGDNIDGMREAVSKPENLKFFDTDEWVDNLQTMFQAILQVANNKGSKAEPFTQALVQECMKISDEDYCKGPVLITALVGAYNTAFPENKPEPETARKTTNPFRDKGPSA